jgi:hypothetical protein
MLTKIKGSVFDSHDNGLPANVKDFGAVDGGGDASSAFHLAIAAADMIIVPAGNWDVSTLGNTAITKSFTLICHEGAILDGKNQTTAQFLIDGTINQTIEKVSFIGGEYKNFDNYVFQCSNLSVVLDGTNSTKIQNLVVRDTNIHDCASGFYAQCVVNRAEIANNKGLDLASSDIKVVGVQIGSGSGNHSSQALILESEDYYVVNNHYENLDCTKVSGAESHGIILYGQKAEVAGNFLKDIDGTTGAEGIYLKCRYSSVHHNKLIDAGTDEGTINIKGLTRAEELLYDSSSPGYSQNVHDNHLVSTTGAYNGIFIQNEGANVHHNHIEGFGSYAVYNKAPTDVSVRLSKYRNIRIKDNFIKNHRGIAALNISNGHVQIIGNTFDGLLANQSTLTEAYAIRVIYGDGTFSTGTDTDNDLHNVVITDNVITDNDESAATTTLYGIYIQGKRNSVDTTIHGLSIANNIIDLLTTDGTLKLRGIALGGVGVIDYPEIYNNTYKLSSTGNRYTLTISSPSGLTLNGLSVHDENALSTSGSDLIDIDTTNVTLTDSSFKDNLFDVPVNNSISTVTYKQVNTVMSNEGAGALRTYSLPVALAGISYSFTRITSQDVRVDPDGTETIGMGGAGKYIQLGADGDFIKIECFTSGQWELTQSLGTITFEA